MASSPEGDDDLASARFSLHAVVEMARRDVSEAEVHAVLSNPGRREIVRPGRVVLTSLSEGTRQGTTRPFVLRVFVDVDRRPPVVVTTYRSSKIAKYWGQK